MSLVEKFNSYRSKMNDRILEQNHKVTNRFFSLDNQTYQDGALDSRTKEMLGLIASYVLRCDDCIKYHLGKCHEVGMTSDEIFEILAVGNVVGGSICIPHMRRAVEYWDELMQST
jgi:AhpD family alkylhydroperoxidase